jgi:dolichol-phosphate mannosyltransferase
MRNIVVILPTYNELENLPRIVPKLMDLDVKGLSVLIVDDDSPDGTGMIANELVLEYPGRVDTIHRVGVQRGLGAAYFDGFRKAITDGADVVVSMDADLSHDPSCIPKMIDLIPQYDLVIGSRYTKGGSIDGNWGISRLLLSHAAQWYIQLMLGLKTRDATSAFRCYSRSTLRHLNFESLWPSGFAFLIEVIYQTERMGLNLIEIPIVFLDRTLGQSKVSPRVIIAAMVQVAKIRLRSVQDSKEFRRRLL